MALLNYSIPLSGAGVCINHVCYVLVVLAEPMRRSYFVFKIHFIAGSKAGLYCFDPGVSRQICLT